MLEQKIEALTAAVERLVAVMSQGAPAQQPAQTFTNVAPQQAAFAQPAPQQPQQPMGMPGAPFPGAGMPQQPQQPQQPTPVQLPFADAQGLLAWAMGKYQTNNAIGPAMEQILKAHGLANITDATPTQFVSLYQQINAL